jgi:hypothetical protein
VVLSFFKSSLSDMSCVSVLQRAQFKVCSWAAAMFFSRAENSAKRREFSNSVEHDQQVFMEKFEQSAYESELLSYPFGERRALISHEHNGSGKTTKSRNIPVNRRSYAFCNVSVMSYLTND